MPAKDAGTCRKGPEIKKVQNFRGLRAEETPNSKDGVFFGELPEA